MTVDDAAFMLLDFDNGALGSIETTRFAGGRKNYNDFEIYGSKGSLKFNFERMNELQFSDLTLPLEEQGYRTILVTEGVHPYLSAWWPCGHIIGYEHTFVNAFNDSSARSVGTRWYRRTWSTARRIFACWKR